MNWQKFFLLVGLISIPIISIGVYKAMSAPLPVGFPLPTSAGKIEVKQYPAYRSGTYVYEGQLDRARNVSFNPLFQHISSNNIAMTAPVEARYPATAFENVAKADDFGKTEVSFLYRSTDIYPAQIAKDIKIEDHAPMLVVSIGDRGEYSFTSYQKQVQELRTWLAANPEYEVIGSPRQFLYDSPFTPDALKRSEVQIQIRLRSL